MQSFHKNLGNGVLPSGMFYGWRTLVLLYRTFELLDPGGGCSSRGL